MLVPLAKAYLEGLGQVTESDARSDLILMPSFKTIVFQANRCACNGRRRRLTSLSRFQDTICAHTNVALFEISDYANCRV